MSQLLKVSKFVLLSVGVFLLCNTLQAQNDFAHVNEYEFNMGDIVEDKIYLVSPEDFKSPIEVRKSADGKWKVKGADAKKVSELLEEGKEIRVIDGKISKFRINEKTESLLSFQPQDATGSGMKRTLEVKKEGTLKIKNTTKRKRKRNLEEMEFEEDKE